MDTRAGPSITISPLVEDDIPGAIAAVQLAFADDPYKKWVFDQATFSPARNHQSLRARCLWGINNAIFVVAKDANATSNAERNKVLGVAMWMPSLKAGTKESWYGWWQGWMLWGRQVMVNLWYGRGGLNVRRYYIWKSAQQTAQSELWTDPRGYYFCNIVTVLPDQQGKGIGKLLFKHVTDRADAEGRKCYLESSRDEPNTEIYTRMGFRKIKEMVCEDKGGVCKGNDNTFGGFPSHLRALVSHALPNVTVKAVVYPKFETRGDLKQCVQKFRDWLQNYVIDIEVKEGTPSPTIDPSVRVILIGHSMGGIVAADTLIAITSETPIPYSATSSPYPSSSGTTNSTTTSASIPASRKARDPSPPHTFLFPYIQGILAFDTPYLGISPSVLAFTAESQYQTASSAYSAISSAASAFGFGSSSGSGSSTPSTPQRSAPSASITAGPAAAKDALSASVDAAAVPAWQRWGKLAMFAGAAGAVAAGGAAAYMKRGDLSTGWNWATSHLEFVGCLMRGEELKTRMTAVVAANSERGVGFADLHTTLGKGASEAGVSVAGGFVEIGGTDGKERTFCNLPTRTEWKGFFEPAINNKATDEVLAHMNMFQPKENPGYYRLSESAKGKVVGWVDKGWYKGSKPKKEQMKNLGGGGDGPVAGEEPILVD